MTKLIGLRTLKTALAVSISIIISNLLNLEYPYFAAMTAILSMHKTTLSSLKMWRNRTIGTLIGALCGICLASISIGNPLLCGLGMILLILILNKLKLGEAIGIAGIVMIAIMVNTQGDLLFYAFNRTLDTLIGGGVSLLINITIFPYYSMTKIDDELDLLWEYTRHLVCQIEIEQNLAVEAEQVNLKLKHFEEHFALYTQEVLFKNRDALAIKCQQHIQMLKELSFHLFAMVLAGKTETIIYDYHKTKALETYNYYLETL